MRLLLVLLFIIVPIAELAVLIQVGQLIGVWWTVAILIADALLGSFLLRTQSRAAWRRFNDAINEGRIPHREVIDGVLVIFGGVLLLTPGFITDVFGLLFLFPPTRVSCAACWSAAARSSSSARCPARRARRTAACATPTTSRATPWTSTPTSWTRRDERALEAPRPLRKPGDTDAVTFSWADAETGLYGLARVATGVSPDGETSASALSVAFEGREPLGAIAEAGEQPPPELTAVTEAPLERWTLEPAAAS